MATSTNEPKTSATVVAGHNKTLTLLLLGMLLASLGGNAYLFSRYRHYQDVNEKNYDALKSHFDLYAKEIRTANDDYRKQLQAIISGLRRKNGTEAFDACDAVALAAGKLGQYFGGVNNIRSQFIAAQLFNGPSDRDVKADEDDFKRYADETDKKSKAWIAYYEGLRDRKLGDPDPKMPE